MTGFAGGPIIFVYAIVSFSCPLVLIINFCPQVDNVFVPAVGSRDSDDLRQNASSPNPFPPEFYLKLLANETIKRRIGAESDYSECADAPFELFDRTGDVRALSELIRLKLNEWINSS